MSHWERREINKLVSEHPDDYKKRFPEPFSAMIPEDASSENKLATEGYVEDHAGSRIESVEATADSNTGTPSVDVTYENDQLSFSFHNIKGEQGNTGSSVDYPYELVNNLTTNDATKGLSAAQGKVLKDDLGQLEAKVDDLSTGKYYGYFAQEEDLPEADVDGFAYVGEGPTYTIYNLRGGVWTSSGITVNQSPVGNDEDIDQNEDGKLQFANRVYNSLQPNGMGYKILRKDSTFAEQVTEANTIYEIRYEFDLNNASVTIPAECVLKFNGGKLLNGTINGQDTIVASAPVQIFSNVSFSGTFSNNGLVEWFGGDFQKCIDAFKNITLLGGKTYNVASTIVFPFNASITGDGTPVVNVSAFPAFKLGYFSTLSGFTISCSTNGNIINIQTENITKTYNERTSGGIANCNILLQNLKIRGDVSTATENHAIDILSDGYYSGGNALSGFWGIKLENLLISGLWKYAVYCDNGSHASNSSVNSWMTGLRFRNINTSNLKNAFYFGRNNAGYGVTGKISSIYIEDCQDQSNTNTEYFAYLSVVDGITFDNCIAWDRGSLKTYYVDKTNCSEIHVTYSENNPDSIWNLCELVGTGACPVYYNRGRNTADTMGANRSILEESGNSPALAGDYRKLPNGMNFIPLDNAILGVLNLKNSVTYGPSGNRGFILLFKWQYYGGIMLWMIVGGGAVVKCVVYKEIPNTLADTDEIGEWDIVPFPQRYSNFADITQSNAAARFGIGFFKEKFFHFPSNYDGVYSARDAYGHQLTENEFISALSALPTFLQPTQAYNGGKMLFVQDVKKEIVYNHSTQKWYEMDGVEAGTLRSGATADRPTGIPTGFCYLDTTLNKPIWYTGSGWVDATGASV